MLLKQEGPTQLHEDNAGCIAIANGSSLTRRSKHYDVTYHFLRDLVAQQKIAMTPCTTNEMIADLLTKPLAREAFQRLRKPLMGPMQQTRGSVARIGSQHSITCNGNETNLLDQPSRRSEPDDDGMYQRP